MFGLAMFVLSSAAAAMEPSTPSSARVYTEEFNSSSNVATFWQPQFFDWFVGDGTYNSQSTGGSITAMYQYPDQFGASTPRDTIYEEYDFEVRLQTPTSQFASVGVVFDYFDTTHYLECLVYSYGSSEVRYVTPQGVTSLGNASALGFGAGEWVDVKVSRRGLSFDIRINGVPVFDNVVGRGLFQQGDVGLIATGVAARVDHVMISVPIGDQPFEESFSEGLPNNWQPTHQTLGQWSVANGTLNNTSVQRTSLTFAPIHTNQFETTAFTLRARMLNPYGASGNLVGIAFNYRPGVGTYHEVVFSPTGVARVNFVTNGVARTLASASYAGRRNVWFDVMIQLSSRLDVAVNGQQLFTNVPATEFGYPEGGVGLITHWAPGRFDDVRFDHGVTMPLSETFSSGLPPSTTTVGTWNTTGATLNATSVGIADLATFGCACWETNYIYRARLLNQYGASGNLVGLIYGYQEPSEPDAGDYYEVVFAPTGQAYMNKIVNGVRYRQASAAHNVGRNVWFDVEIVRSSINTTVKVNGVTIFTRVVQGQFGPGRVGVITHWARGRFDNLSISPMLVRDL